MVAILQVKGMDDALYKALGARAARDNRSISQEVVTVIEEFLARRGESPASATRAFLELAGSWRDERSAKKIAGELRRARRNRGRRSRIKDVFD
jgi:plasmid stability protein